MYKTTIMEFLLRHIDTGVAGFFAVAGFLSMLLFLYSVQKKSSRLRRNDSRISPPEAAGRWPIIGHLHLLGGSQLPHITLANLADKYGPIFTIHIGVHPTLVISSWESAKECFTTHDLAVSTRPKLISSEILGWNYASFGFAPYGPYWREIRKITTSELLSNKSLEKLRHVRESEVESFVKSLYKLWTKRETGSDRVMVEMGKRIGDVSLNVALRVVARKRYFGDDSRDEKEARRCKEAMREFFRLTGLFLVGDAIPFLRWLDLGGYEKAMKKTHDELESIVEEWLEEHRQRRGSGNFGGEKDFMDVMLSKLEESTDLSGYDADIVNKATCMNIISGGTDTTAVTLTWALSLLLNNKSVLQKVQEELDLHVGKERPVKESDISNLVYLQAVVKETLRLYPAGPLSGIREFSEDCTIGGYHVPKGTRLITNLWKIQTDPKTWSDDPLEFKPERFLTTHKDVDVKGKHFELIPFGAGRRSCPGMTYGLQMTHFVIAGLLQAFDVFTDGPVDMTAIFGLTNAKATPLEVLVKPRLSISLYE